MLAYFDALILIHRFLIFLQNGSLVIDKIYSKYATEDQKLFLRQDFYGDQFKRNKNNKYKSLKVVFSEFPDLKREVLLCVWKSLEKILSK